MKEGMFDFKNKMTGSRFARNDQHSRSPPKTVDAVDYGDGVFGGRR